MAKRYLGYGYTNAQGIAKLEYDADGEPLTHSYTGVGAGKIDIVAESGTLQSETFAILDCLFYDRANSSSHYDEYVNYQSYLDVSYTSDYTDLKENSNEHGRYSIASNSAYISFPLGTRFECDLKCVDGETSNTPLRIMNASATSQLSSPTIVNLGLVVGEFGHFTVDITEDGMLITREDGTTTTKALPSSTTTNVAFAFWTHGSITNLQFKNLKIYPI